MTQHFCPRLNTPKENTKRRRNKRTPNIWPYIRPRATAERKSQLRSLIMTNDPSKYVQGDVVPNIKEAF